MKTFNLTEELALLKNNCIAQIKKYNLPLQIKPADMSFSYWNWIITLPFNYYYLVPNIHKSLIRKLAVINALYGYYFMAEDDVFDEYHLLPEKYKIILAKYCAVKGLRNLSIAHLLSISGPDIYDYVYKYESLYYHTLLSEKRADPSFNEPKSIENSIVLLGEKAAPAIIPFAAFCILNKCEQYIESGELLIKKYHIAHQIYDDWQDIELDLRRPEKSWLINYFSRETGSELNDPREIRNIISCKNNNLQILELICSYLAEARGLVKKLRFVHFDENIRHLENLAINNIQRAGM